MTSTNFPRLSDLPAKLVVELRPISITQPPLGRVIQLLLQVEGFEPEAGRIKCANFWWGRDDKYQVAERFADGLLRKAHEIVVAQDRV